MSNKRFLNTIATVHAKYCPVLLTLFYFLFDTIYTAGCRQTPPGIRDWISPMDLQPTIKGLNTCCSNAIHHIKAKRTKSHLMVNELSRSTARFVIYFFGVLFVY